MKFKCENESQNPKKLSIIIQIELQLTLLTNRKFCNLSCQDSRVILGDLCLPSLLSMCSNFFICWKKDEKTVCLTVCDASCVCWECSLLAPQALKFCGIVILNYLFWRYLLTFTLWTLYICHRRRKYSQLLSQYFLNVTTSCYQFTINSYLSLYEMSHSKIAQLL